MRDRGSIMTPPRHGAFTLIELLVVIAIIALLIGILLPALGYARNESRATYEQAVLKQQVTAYSAYLTDYKDQCLPAAPNWGWVHHYGIAQHWMFPPDPYEGNTVMSDTVTKTWTWHFIGATGYSLNALQIDKGTYTDFVSRPHAPQPVMAGVNDYLASSSVQAFGYHPSFGMNGVYVGGAYTHGAFRNVHAPYYLPGGNTAAQGGTFWVTAGVQVQRPEKLMIFLSTRGCDTRDGNMWSWGALPPDPGTNGASANAPIQPGYFIAEPPKPHPTGRADGSPVNLAGAWIASNKYDPTQPPSRWGQVRCQYFGKAATGMFDGHVVSQTLEQLRDMRKWSNKATIPDWNFQQGP